MNWTIDPESRTGGYAINGADGRCVALAIQRDPHPTLGQGISLAEARGNADLITASPDMLAALRMIDARLKAAWADRSLPASVMTGAEVSQYEAAIKKATTGEPA